MPELAEVETVKRGLEASVINRVISKVDSDGSERFKAAEFTYLDKITSITRRGKYLIFHLETNRDMIVHLGMTGALLVTPQSAQLSRFRARWVFDDVTLTLIDPRGFGRVGVVDAGDYSSFKGLSGLGPEPLDNFDPKPFVEAFAKEGQTVKARLLGQKHLAGVGNYVCDEALWRAKINPKRRQLSKKESLELVNAIISVLNDGIARGGLSTRDYQQVDGTKGSMIDFLDVYGRAGEPCSRCQSTIIKEVVAGRGTSFCPRCQRPPTKAKP